MTHPVLLTVAVFFSTLLVEVLGASVAEAETRRYAVIVAHNRDIARDIAPLAYADDDGARYYELFSHIADEVTLYTVLDEDSQRLYTRAASHARAPRRADVLAGVERVFEQARNDVARGHEVVFYFVLIGHGDIGAGGEGHVSLLDAPFTRTDLFQHVLARSTATTNHVIVDACNSYFMVHRRGGEADDGGPSQREAVLSFLARENLDRYPNTGVLLSTSTEQESHEWSAYGAGVFSHQLRSALTGAADVNGDGRIEYSEVEAFIAAANLRVTNPSARVEVFARPPAIDLSRPITDLRAARFRHWLGVPAGQAVRMYLEDARGVRYLDAHLSGERAVVLGLVDSPYYFVRTSDGAREARIDLARPGRRVEFDPAALRASTVAARGSVTESFRKALYAEPYGPGFYRGFVAARNMRAVPETQEPWLPAPTGDVDPGVPAVPAPSAIQPTEAMAATGASPPSPDLMARRDPRADTARKPRRVAAWSSAAVGAGLATAGVWSLLEARSRQDAFLRTYVDDSGNVHGISPAAATRAESRARAWSIAGGLMLVGASISGITATVLFMSDGDTTRPAGIAISGDL